MYSGTKVIGIPHSQNIRQLSVIISVSAQKKSVTLMRQISIQENYFSFIKIICSLFNFHLLPQSQTLFLSCIYSDIPNTGIAHVTSECVTPCR